MASGLYLDKKRKETSTGYLRGMSCLKTHLNTPSKQIIHTRPFLAT